MPEAQPWTVVVLGSWNRAILTPVGIGTRLLGMKKGEGLQVEVPINVPGPARVRHGALGIVVDRERLVIESPPGEYDAMEKAMAVAKAAILDLPKTPLAAVGFNLYFALAEVAPALPATWWAAWDGVLEASGRAISRRMSLRVFPWKLGTIAIAVEQQQDGTGMVGLNFERRSEDYSDLSAWCEIAIGELRAEADGLLGLLK